MRAWAGDEEEPDALKAATGVKFAYGGAQTGNSG